MNVERLTKEPTYSELKQASRNGTVKESAEVEHQKIKVAIRKDGNGVPVEASFTKFLVNLPFLDTILTARSNDGRMDGAPPSVHLILRNDLDSHVMFEKIFTGLTTNNGSLDLIKKSVVNSELLPKTSLRNLLEWVDPQLEKMIKDSKEIHKHIEGIDTMNGILENIRVRLVLISLPDN